MICSKFSVMDKNYMKIHVKAQAFFLLLSCGCVIEIKVLKQIRSCFIQIEGCERQFIKVLRKAAEEMGIHQGK